MSALLRNAKSLSPPQQHALLRLYRAGAQPLIRSVYGRRDEPESFISPRTAQALTRAGLAIMTHKWLSLTPRGRCYAELLARPGAQREDAA